MEFKDLKIGNSVYILENAGTFRKINTYNIGTVVLVTLPYDDTTINNPYLANTLKKKVIDITISCEGILKKLTVGADKTTITDPSIGLTISTSKDELVTLLLTQYKEYLDKIQAIEFYKEEANKCKRILDQLKNSQLSTDDNPITTADTIKVS